LQVLQTVVNRPRLGRRFNVSNMFMFIRQSRQHYMPDRQKQTVRQTNRQTENTDNMTNLNMQYATVSCMLKFLVSFSFLSFFCDFCCKSHFFSMFNDYHFVIILRLSKVFSV